MTGEDLEVEIRWKVYWHVYQIEFKGTARHKSMKYVFIYVLTGKSINDITDIVK